uniref:Uncharacterized protein n=1 Tax=Ananas comosus var. bracteatus TaxID=296719 RepID=A0A6V7NSK4_ANACO|nr:unnamed protein product [Ananas comosus var. bracteatus]
MEHRSKHRKVATVRESEKELREHRSKHRKVATVRVHRKTVEDRELREVAREREYRAKEATPRAAATKLTRCNPEVVVDLLALKLLRSTTSDPPELKPAPPPRRSPGFHCRDPVRCTRCFKTGHFARACMDRLPLPVYRFMRARPSYLSAFVPLSDDFIARQNRRRNAILVDVLPPANLGHFPQDTIANELASRFGGFSSDFHVARYRERDYVVFLPEWVPTDRLIRREVLNLGALRLRCSPWDPYHGARRPPLTYKAWIRFVSLPYECWSSRTVAALVGGFGRFIRPDDFSARMVDLSGYRCLIAVNHLSDIPENLEITFGDLSIYVLIQLERWDRADAFGRGNLPNEGSDQHTPHDGPSARDLHAARSDRGRCSSDGGDSNSDASWNSSEIRDRRCAIQPVPHGRRDDRGPPSHGAAPHPRRDVRGPPSHSAAPLHVGAPSRLPPSAPTPPFRQLFANAFFAPVPAKGSFVSLAQGSLLAALDKRGFGGIFFSLGNRRSFFLRFSTSFSFPVRATSKLVVGSLGSLLLHAPFGSDVWSGSAKLLSCHLGPKWTLIRRSGPDLSSSGLSASTKAPCWLPPSWCSGLGRGSGLGSATGGLDAGIVTDLGVGFGADLGAGSGAALRAGSDVGLEASFGEVLSAGLEPDRGKGLGAGPDEGLETRLGASSVDDLGAGSPTGLGAFKAPSDLAGGFGLVELERPEAARGDGGGGGGAASEGGGGGSGGGEGVLGGGEEDGDRRRGLWVLGFGKEGCGDL